MGKATNEMPTNKKSSHLHAYAASKLYARWHDKQGYPFSGVGACRAALTFPVLNQTSDKWESAVNVTISPSPFDFNSLETIQCLGLPSTEACDIGIGHHKLKYHDVGYMQLLIETILGWGYTAGKDLLGAAFDWRFAPDSPMLDEFYSNLTTSIEKSVNSTGNKVCILGHSYGNIIAKYFLDERTTVDWRQYYIGCVFHVAASWGGAIKTTMEVTSGENMPLFMDAATVRDFSRNASAIATMLPSAQVFDEEHVFASVNGVDYKINEMEQYLKDVGDYFSYKTYDSWYKKRLDRPYIETFCIHGSNMPTPSKYVYTLNLDEPSEIINENSGDGTVNKASLDVCKTWESLHGPKITVKEFPSVSHVGIIRDDGFFDYLLEKLKEKSSAPAVSKHFQPVLVTLQQAKKGQVCFSRRPVFQCHPEFVMIQSAGQRNVSFVCFEKSSQKLPKLLLKTKSKVENAFHLTAYNTTYTALIEIPMECNTLNYGASFV
uniref:Lecithin:cholesterol acyltransferase family protein n=1 Tax=Ditylenchus dipsaci TaxID=166011 RepID=A0A915D9Z9_9BILA